MKMTELVFFFQSSAERSLWKGIRFLSLSLVIVECVVAATALRCCFTIHKRSTGVSVF